MSVFALKPLSLFINAITNMENNNLENHLSTAHHNGENKQNP